MDVSHVALLMLTLTEAGFKSFRADQETTVGIDINNLIKLLRCGNTEDELILELQENQSTLHV